MRFPMRSFYDLRSGGTVCHIFANIYRYKFENNANDYTQMARYVHFKLIDQKLLRPPTAFIQTSVNDDLRNQIIQTCNDCDCEITENIELATHIVYPTIGIHDSFIPTTFNFVSKNFFSISFPSFIWMQLRLRYIV